MQQVAARLGELAEFYDRKPPTPNALKVWADAFTGCACLDVMDCLTDWPRTKRAFPVASEIVEACRLRNAQRHESLSKRGAEPMQLSPSDPDSPAYLKFKAWWAAFKANPPYCPYPDRIGSFVRLGAVLTDAISQLQPTDTDEWWRRILRAHRRGEALKLAQLEFARQAAINAHVDPDTCDLDPEGTAERAAIQAEGQ